MLLQCICHWRLALLEYSCTPGPNGKLPSELLFDSFMTPVLVFPMPINFQNGGKKRKISLMQDIRVKPLVIGSTVSFLNSDLKTWSMGRIHGRSSDNRSYEILPENGLVISRNRVHMHETGVVFRELVPISISIADPISDACKAESGKASKLLQVPNNPPSTAPHVNATKSSIGSNDNCYRTRSRRVV